MQPEIIVADGPAKITGVCQAPKCVVAPLRGGDRTIERNMRRVGVYHPTMAGRQTMGRMGPKDWWHTECAEKAGLRAHRRQQPPSLF